MKNPTSLSGATHASSLPAQSGVGRIFRATYCNAREEEELKLFKDRDAMAAYELTAHLSNHKGYHLGTSIQLYPSEQRDLTAFPAFRPNDIILLTTRPPLDDRMKVDDGKAFPPKRKCYQRSGCELEDCIFRELGDYISYCNRKRLELTDKAFKLLKVQQGRHEPDMWKDLEFYEYCVTSIAEAGVLVHHMGKDSIKPDRKQPPYTVGFFLYLPCIRKVGCSLIVSFGMNGDATLMWNRIIRTRYSQWLEKPVGGPRFVMAQVIFRKSVPINPLPLTPEFADDEKAYEVRLLTE